MDRTVSDGQKVAVVTGGARRIGRVVAESLHAQGYAVMIHCCASVADAAKLADDMNKKRPGSAAWHAADLTRPDGVDSLVRRLGDWAPRVDVLVNNASLYFPTPIGQASWEQAQALMVSNAMAPFFLTQSLADRLKAHKGTVINLVDAMVDRAMPGFALYHMAKSALVALTRTLAVELAPDVRVNAVAPGAILWPAGPSEPSAAQKQGILDAIPMGRLGGPDAIADAVVFLATRADYMTGEILRVDGGRALK